jgi:hypothetical protein
MHKVFDLKLNINSLYYKSNRQVFLFWDVEISGGVEGGF